MPYCHLKKFTRFGGNMKYIDWLIQWLENYVRPSVKMRTYERYKLIIEQHIKDNIGGMELNDLSPLVLQSFITELLQSGNRKTGKELSANSVNAIISVIQSSLKTAHLLGLTKCLNCSERNETETLHPNSTTKEGLKLNRRYKT